MRKAAQLPQASMDSQETEAAMAMLREVSPGLLVQLEEAATCCNISQVDQIIAEMRRHHPAFADVLMSFAREFDYVKIVSTIHGAGYAACYRAIT
jgi:hypothetical protein